ncbi:hypothetical protein [Pandoraea sp. NPDC087047]|uniref:hypothetical protein n=1 Tax=Pandoraea sp. NPDC087047 TaxID=3364390 RepID=UPI0038304C8A
MDTTRIALRAIISAAFVACGLGAGAACAQSTFPPPAIQAEAAVGQKIAIWEQSNYSVLCRDLGTPTFQLESKPALGEVMPEWLSYTVPTGQRCEDMKFSGMIVWYQAGQVPGTDVVVWRVGFPREFGTHTPNTGDHRVTTTIVIR